MTNGAWVLGLIVLLGCHSASEPVDSEDAAVRSDGSDSQVARPDVGFRPYDSGVYDSTGDGFLGWDVLRQPHDDAVPSPDGEGVCCPFTWPSCDCVKTGGFALTGGACWDVEDGRCDAPPYYYRDTIDEHGCYYFRVVPVDDPDWCWTRYRDAGTDGGDAGP